MKHRDVQTLLAHTSLPAAMVDLGALERNIDHIVMSARAHGKKVRVATKSVRHVGLLRRILARGGDTIQGWLCFTSEEAVWLAHQGFADLVVAYPSARPGPVAQVAQAIREGHTIRLMVDSLEQMHVIEMQAQKVGVSVPVIVDVDVSYRAMGSLHIGVRRSPIRDPLHVEGLLQSARSLSHVHVCGFMGYEAQIAGVPDDSPVRAALNPVKKWLKRRSVPDVAKRRKRTAEVFEQQGVDLELVNGGGTGSLNSTGADPTVTEITVGSGFLCSHLFDHYIGLTLEPAAFFALEVCRIPAPGWVTCAGGGYVASGEPSPDRLPLPYCPSGLRLGQMEGAGEVQTPLRHENSVVLKEGDPVVFRHAKAGELAERFANYHLFRGVEFVGVEPTYRGDGQCFL